MKKLALYCFAVMAITVLSGCNTVHGFGQDVQHVGEKIDKAAK
jgi:entericidin A